MRPGDAFRFHRRMRGYGERSNPSAMAHIRIITTSAAAIQEGAIARYRANRLGVLTTACSIKVSAISAAGSADLSGQVIKTLDFPAGLDHVEFSFQTVNRSGTQGDRRLTVTAGEPVNCVIDGGYSLAICTIQDKVTVPTTNRSGLPWKSGARTHGSWDQQQYTYIEQWRGRGLDCGLLYIDGSEFNVRSAKNPNGALVITDLITNKLTAVDGALKRAQFGGKKYNQVLSIPLCIGADSNQFVKVRDDADYARTHQAIADQLLPLVGTQTAVPTYIRLGWEANSGYPWSLDVGSTADLAAYVAAWRKHAKIYKDTVPSAKLIWNTLKAGKGNLANYYPGDDRVDYIGLDEYDNGSSGGFIINEAAWNKGAQKGEFNVSTGKIQGWYGVKQFAISRGKKMCIEEWGPSNPGTGVDGPPVATSQANNSFFVGRMFDFFNELNDLDMLELEMFFNAGIAEKNSIIRSNGDIFEPNRKVADAYKAAYTP